MHQPSSTDSSLVAVSRETEETLKVKARVFRALRWIPNDLKQQLKNFGVTVLIGSALPEAVPGDLALPAEIAHESTYNEANKIIYVAEHSADSDDSNYQSVLIGCAQAYNHLSGITRSAIFTEAFEADIGDMSEKYRRRYQLAPHPTPTTVLNTYCALFMTILEFSENAPMLLIEIKEAFPRTSEILERLFESAR